MTAMILGELYTEELRDIKKAMRLRELPGKGAGSISEEGDRQPYKLQESTRSSCIKVCISFIIASQLISMLNIGAEVPERPVFVKTGSRRRRASSSMRFLRRADKIFALHSPRSAIKRIREIIRSKYGEKVTHGPIPAELPLR